MRKDLNLRRQYVKKRSIAAFTSGEFRRKPPSTFSHPSLSIGGT